MRQCIETVTNVTKSAWTLLGVLIVFALEGVQGEQCVYRQSVYNPLFSTYDKVLTTKECHWGCCDFHSSPCCNVKVGLVVGCIVGGVMGLCLIVITIVCCCMKHMRKQNADAERGQRQRNRTDAVVYHTESSQHADLEPSISVYDPPPSYDEVMRGETNEGFKPD